LREHLRQQGITKLGEQGKRPTPGTFEAHIAAVSERFWSKRFQVYGKWKRKWYDAYERQGFFVTKTGFVCQGYIKRNQVINYPVQGSAFHCLLWSLNRLVLQEVKARGLKARVVGQVHDSIVADVPDEELGDFLALCKRVMVDQLREHWSWITVPLEIEAEVTPINGSWDQKEVVKI
jgi:hypothetical protein